MTQGLVRDQLAGLHGSRGCCLRGAGVVTVRIGEEGLRKPSLFTPSTWKAYDVDSTKSSMLTVVLVSPDMLLLLDSLYRAEGAKYTT